MGRWCPQSDFESDIRKVHRFDSCIGSMEDTRAYCINGDGNLAVGESLVGMFYEDEVVELVCYDCLNKSDNREVD